MSWRRTVPDCEIIIFGQAPGADDLIAEVDASYRPDVECNDHGTPLISAMFANAQNAARHKTLCYINGDIILLSDFAAALARLSRWPSFAAVGQRWDMDLEEAIDFSSAKWQRCLQAALRKQGCRHDPAAMDYFAFPKGAVGDLPPFAIGRPAWDNYLVSHFRRRGVPMVDLTRVTFPIHQNHDYAHVPQRQGLAWAGPEADRNLTLADARSGGFNPHYHTIMNAKRRMGKHAIIPALSPRRLIWRLMAPLPDRYRGLGPKLGHRVVRGCFPVLAGRSSVGAEICRRRPE